MELVTLRDLAQPDKPVHPGDVVNQAARVNVVAALPLALAVGATVTANQGTPGTLPWPVSASSLPLPDGAATDATLGNLSNKIPPPVAAGLPVSPNTAALPVAVGVLPLPVHAATDTLQTAGNQSLATIAGNIPAVVNGRQPVDGSGVTQPISAAALPLPTGASTELSLSRGLRLDELAFVNDIDQSTMLLVTRGTIRNLLTLNNRGGR